MTRPYPPEDLVNFSNIEMADRFIPSQDLQDWIIDTFIIDGGPLSNSDHAHLRDARLGVLWTNSDNSKNMRTIIGQAELMPPMAMGKWPRARAIQQIEEWFGEVPDFLLTFSAPACAGMDDPSFCALVEHELSHCGQKLDEFGMPKFKNDGAPVFCMKGHDIEEFVGVVRRYGAYSPELQAMKEAMNSAPGVPAFNVAQACGTCRARAA